MVHASLQSTGAKLAMVAFRVADRHKSTSVGLIVYLTILEDINWSQVDLGGPRVTTGVGPPSDEFENPRAVSSASTGWPRTTANVWLKLAVTSVSCSAHGWTSRT